MYALLTLLLGGTYAGVVLVLGQSGGIGTEPPSWAVAGATLAVAALFRPTAAARTIERSSAWLRDEIDLDTLTAELLTVVHETVQPTAASLWLRPSEDRASLASTTDCGAMGRSGRTRAAPRAGPPTSPGLG